MTSYFVARNNFFQFRSTFAAFAAGFWTAGVECTAFELVSVDRKFTAEGYLTLFAFEVQKELHLLLI